ncbi:diacylglycerol kinase family protein [Bacillus safensis]|uniref:diacylglycerol kinase family protein n=1 Tax=Bacillus safensis TaxID=561879 RepID=UPI002281CB0A|nr:diacylglycerol kinase family protein [Bacillus safensis]MCY7734924.1 diacylglycerol kinase family protein [Bacillus safensis]MEC1114712.1 diacylglycerol kinase family protein [Bacillus safensis]
MAFRDHRKKRRPLARFFRSFYYAFRGIWRTFLNERNFRFHTVAAIIVVICGFWFRIDPFEWMIVLLLCGGMFALELVNTAIEHTVDLMTEERHPLAERAKDAAAGAVCVYAAISVMIGLIIFLPKIMQ